MPTGKKYNTAKGAYGVALLNTEGVNQGYVDGRSVGQGYDIE